MHHRTATRDLCSELVFITYTPTVSQPARATSGNLEEIGESSALILSEVPIPRGFKIWINCEMHHLKGRVKSCKLHPELGYFVEVALDPDSCWSPAWFYPQAPAASISPDRRISDSP